MGRRRRTAHGARQVSLALLIAVPLVLSQPAAGQTTNPDGPLAGSIDPDCYRELPERIDMSRVEDSDGVCPPEALELPAPKPDAGPRPDRRPEHGTPGDKPAPPGPPAGRRPAARGDGGSGGAVPPKKGRKRSKGREPTGGTPAAPAPEAKPERPRRERGADKPAPAPATPEFGVGLPGPAYPDFIEQGTRIPRFLYPIYHAAAARYGIRWEILAAINDIETDFGRNLNVSWAGATGWMQFMPATWSAYGTDGNGDGEKDPYDPNDAIFSAARYLSASGYEQDVRGALFAYNHATWYVEDVLERARSIAGEYLSPPRAKRLDAKFASRLTRRAERAGVAWELMLAVLRARGECGAVPASRRQLDDLARRLVRLGARKHARRAVRRLERLEPYDTPPRPRLLARETSFTDRVVALAHYNKAVGIDGLTRGLKAVKERLARRVLESPRLDIYPGGRADVADGVTSVRVLALLAYLSSRYEQVGVTSLTSGHSFLTASGNVSAHSYGRAVDIATLNGTPMLGHQEEGGVTERGLWSVLLLPDELGPSELISLLDLPGPSFPLPDHADHIHVGY
jgi:hypothetical protein